MAQPVHERLWTPANVVTLLRICLVPVFVVAIISPWPAYFPQWTEADIWKPWIAAGIFMLLAATDGLDGYLARSRGEVTNFGKFIDPLADKILVAAALLALIELGVLPSWVALIILTREFIVSGIRMVAAAQGVVIAASWYGKAKTVFQIIAILLFIVKDSVFVTDSPLGLESPLYLISWLVMLVALVLTIVSMLDYFVKAKELLGFVSPKQEKIAAVRAAEPAAVAFDELTDEAILASIQPESLQAQAQRVVDLALQKKVTLCCAESLTGGMLSSMLTAIPGSSAALKGGVVSYTNEVKHALLHVRRETLSLCGAVSEETAVAMAVGARSQLQADVAVSVTGIAGPGGAEPGKPVGTVWVGLADASMTVASCHHFAGTRQQVRLQTVAAALDVFERAITQR